MSSASSPSKARWATSASWRSLADGPRVGAVRPGCPRATSRTARRRRRPPRRPAPGGAARPGRGRPRRWLVISAKNAGSSAAVSSSMCCHSRTCGSRRPGACRLEEGGHGLEPAGDRLEPLGQRGVVAGEQQEQAVADVVEGQRAALPDAQDVDVEDVAADVVQLQVALEAHGRRQRRRVDGLDGRQVGAVVGEVGQEGLATAVTELAVALVQAEVRAQHRAVRDEPTEASFDEVVERARRRDPRSGTAAGRGRRVVSRVSVTGRSSLLVGPVRASR